MGAPMQTLEQNLLDTIVRYIEKTKAFLADNEIVVESSRLSDVLDALPRLKVMLSSKTYAGFATDANGYIIRAIPLDSFEEISKLPADVSAGYYKYENGQFYLDEERRRQLEEV